MSKSTAADRRSRRVLIADDDKEFREVVVQLFRKHGYLVTECRHGIELLDHLRCLKEASEPNEFDLIISDIRMPGVTGLSVLEGLRQFDSMPPVILITAFGDEQLHNEAQRLGAAAMIDKPFEIAVLLAKAEEIVNSKPVGR